MKKFAFLLALPLLSTPGFAWWPKGHSMIAQSAVEVLPADVPSWFREGGALVAHCAQDPDVQKNRPLAMMTEEEGPQHYFDWELIEGKLPPTRAAFYALCREKKVKPEDVGELPYALAEWTQRLTITFAEARKFPENKEIQTKALVYAGILSHYSGDCAMPLHVTIHHDGRVKADGKSPRSGIHTKVDSLIEKIAPTFSKSPTISAFPKLWEAIEAELKMTATQIDRTYELEGALPPETGEWKPTPEILALTTERANAARNFTARLFLTAWIDSAKTKLPVWLER